jgi:hypothetical protein
MAMKPVITAPITMAKLTVRPKNLRPGVVFVSGIDVSSPDQLNKISHRVNVKSAARQGYTRMSGESSCSNLVRKKTYLTMAVRMMPITPHKIHAGKNEPRILNDGAREQPVCRNVAAITIPIEVYLNPFCDLSLLFLMLRAPGVE